MNAREIYPNKNLKNICYINNIIKNPNIIIGDYTYYNTEKMQKILKMTVLYIIIKNLVINLLLENSVQ